MLFGLVLLLLTAGIAYFHYVQGFFSATISAILTVIAAMLAMGFHEQVAHLLFKAGVFDDASSVALVALFAIIYLVLRIVFDMTIPGNVRYPVWVDRIGAAVMGALAGLMATGILAIACEALPFGPSAPAPRYSLQSEDKQYSWFSGQKNMDAIAHSMMQGDSFDDAGASVSHLILSQDDLVVNMTELLSDQGSLAGSQAFGAVHPDYLTELFGQRLGMQTGTRRVFNSPEQQPISVVGVYTQDKLTQIDGDGGTTPLLRDSRPSSSLISGTDQSGATKTILIVRIHVNPGHASSDDSDSLLRFSPGAARLVTGHPSPHGSAQFKDYFPVAVLEPSMTGDAPSGIAVAYRTDDFLLTNVSGQRTIDLIYMVDRDMAFTDRKSAPPYSLNPGSFLEIKRYGVVDLSGSKVDYGPGPNPDHDDLIRTVALDRDIANTKPEAINIPQALIDAMPKNRPGQALGDTGLKYDKIEISEDLPDKVDTHNNGKPGNIRWGDVNGIVQNRHWIRLTIPADATLDTLKSPGKDLIGTLDVPQNRKLVQIFCKTPDQTSKSTHVWDWVTKINEFALADDQGKTFTPIGIWATVKNDDGTQCLAVSYKNLDPQRHLDPIEASQGAPTEIGILFEVPDTSTVQELRFTGSSVLNNLNFKVQ